MQIPHNPFKAALRAGRQQLGLWASINDATVAEMLGTCGYDWMLFDCEHSSIERSDIPDLLRALDTSPTEAVVRPVSLDPAEIKKLLDFGARNILVPYVQTVEEAELAARAVAYAPAGMRGVAGITRAARFGAVDGYIAKARSEIALLIQIETARAVDDLDAILAVDGIDGAFVGPADLAASLGYPGQPTHPEVRKVCGDVIRRIRAAGLPAGFLALDEGFVAEMVDAGSLFTAVDVDAAILLRGARERAAAWRARTGG